MKSFILTLFICVCVMKGQSQNSEVTDYQIEGMTIATTNMGQMLDFYSNTFNITFSEQRINEFKLYAGKWGGMKVLLCPAELAGNKATQNRHQFDVIVPDLEDIITITSKYGGTTMGGKIEDEHAWSIGIYDPDKNSILFKQLKQ